MAYALELKAHAVKFEAMADVDWLTKAIIELFC